MVTPSRIFCSPLARRVIIPSWMAICLSWVASPAPQNEFPEAIADLHHLEEPYSALVARVVAGVATPASIGEDLRGFGRRESRVDEAFNRWLGRLPALAADAADQPLGADQMDRARHQEGLHTHIGEAADGGGGIVGVESAEHQVAGQSRLDRDLGRFQVAHFAHQHDVGILAQEGPQAVAKVNPICSLT